MSQETKRKFGVKRIGRFNLDLICKDCKQRAGTHHGDKCPAINPKTGKLLYP